MFYKQWFEKCGKVMHEEEDEQEEQEQEQEQEEQEEAFVLEALPLRGWLKKVLLYTFIKCQRVRKCFDYTRT